MSETTNFGSESAPCQNSTSRSTQDCHSTTGAEMEELGALNPPKVADEDRSCYERTMEERLSELGARIDELGMKAEEMKEQAAVKVKELREKQQEASVKLQSLKETSAEAWGEFKHGMDNCFEELSKAWEEMKAGSARAASKFEK